MSVPVIGTTPVLCDNPPVKPVPVGAVHVYKVPEGTMPLAPLTGTTLKFTPLQATAVIALMLATGLIATINVNGIALPQFIVIGVTT